MYIQKKYKLYMYYLYYSHNPLLVINLDFAIRTVIHICLYHEISPDVFMLMECLCMTVCVLLLLFYSFMTMVYTRVLLPTIFLHL